MIHDFKFLVTLLSFVLLFTFTGCSDRDGFDCEMKRFAFLKADNSGLTADCEAVMNGTDVRITVPPRTDVRSLVARFDATGAMVRIGQAIQTSGVTVNDFTSTVVYVVVAEDQTVRNYAVTVTVEDLPGAVDKAITRFVFEKALNKHLFADVEGQISGSVDRPVIEIELPSTIDRTSLVATFETTGVRVTVGGKEQISGVTAMDFTGDVVEYFVMAENESVVVYTVKVKVYELSSEMKSFRFEKRHNPGLKEDVVLNVDHTEKTITGYVGKWIESATPDKLIPTFTTDVSVTVYVDGVEQVSGVTEHSFQNELVYTVRLSGQQESGYTVKVISPQVTQQLPILRFSVALNRIQSKDVYEKSKLEMLDNGVTGGNGWSYDQKEVEIRLRGNSTTGLPKKPFRVKFPDKISPLGLTHCSEKNWVLLANDADKSLLRNAVAFAVSRTLLKKGDPFHKDKAILFTAATQFVDVYVGDEYQGVYHLTDQVQAKKGRVDLKEPDPAAGGDKLTGGYLLELDGFAHSEFAYFDTPKGMPVTLKFPDLEDNDHENYTVQSAAFKDRRYLYIKDYYANAENKLFSSSYKDPENGWRNYFDESTLIDYYIISEFTGNPDAWWSTYMYKLRNSDNEDLFFGPVWDFDIAFDNDNRIGDATHRLMLDAAHEPRTWMTRFLTDEKLKSAIKDRWNDKKAELLAHALATLEADSEAMSKSIEANFRKWDIGSQALGHGMQRNFRSYDAALVQLKEYIHARYKYLDGRLNTW
jgi:hypothetical protein